MCNHERSTFDALIFWRFGCIAALCGVELAVSWGHTKYIYIYPIHRLHEATMYLNMWNQRKFCKEFSELQRLAEHGK